MNGVQCLNGSSSSSSCNRSCRQVVACSLSFFHCNLTEILYIYPLHWLLTLTTADLHPAGTSTPSHFPPSRKQNAFQAFICTRQIWPCWAAVAMGDSMSKRLKLVTSSESEMEERSFLNPFPDWDQGVLTSSPSAANSSTGDTFDANGKVSHAVFLQNLTRIFLQVPPPWASKNLV